MVHKFVQYVIDSTFTSSKHILSCNTCSTSHASRGGFIAPARLSQSMPCVESGKEKHTFLLGQVLPSASLLSTVRTCLAWDPHALLALRAFTTNGNALESCQPHSIAVSNVRPPHRPSLSRRILIVTLLSSFLCHVKLAQPQTSQKPPTN